MSLSINVQKLQEEPVSLAGEVTPGELDIDALDELVKASKPLIYRIEARKLDQQILLQGRLSLTLDCECARCLKPYEHPIVFDPWICHIPLEGDEKPLIINDLLDLTPCVREDILLAFPQHPLCKNECVGLPNLSQNPDRKPDGESTSAWAGLNELELEE